MTGAPAGATLHPMHRDVASKAINASSSTTERDRKVIVSAFADNEQLLKSIRAVLLNLDPNEDEKKAVWGLSDDVKRIIRERFLPSLHKDMPLANAGDGWLGMETMVFGQDVNSIQQAISYKEGALKATEQILKRLDGESEPFSLEYRPSPVDHLGVNLLVRNQLINHVWSQIFALWVIANQKQETPVELAKRAHKDSMQ